MPSRRKSRFETPPDPPKVIRSLQACRYAMREMQRHVTIGGPVYLTRQAITAAIDGLAFPLTGDRTYFWTTAGGASEGQRVAIAEKAARERRTSCGREFGLPHLRCARALIRTDVNLAAPAALLSVGAHGRRTHRLVAFFIF